MPSEAARLLDATFAPTRAADALWKASSTYKAFETSKTLMDRMGYASGRATAEVYARTVGARWPEWQHFSLESAAHRVWRELQEPHFGWRDQTAAARHFQDEMDRHKRLSALLKPSAAEEALKAVDRSVRYSLPATLELYRTDADVLAHRLAGVRAAEWWRDSAHLKAFAEASAMADALRGVSMNATLAAAMDSFSATALPKLPGLAQHRAFLDAAGLVLPRWPRVRVLSRSERRKRLYDRLRGYAQPAHVRKATSLVHRYELVLRDAIDYVMSDAYGEEWWIERLPASECKDLLGRWEKRGGNVLDHADYIHYARIMCHPEHHAAGFDVGFPDPEALAACRTEGQCVKRSSESAAEKA